jgi:hypothetical protein
MLRLVDGKLYDDDVLVDISIIHTLVHIAEENNKEVTTGSMLPVEIGHVPAFDIIIPAEQIQQGKISVKVPDMKGHMISGSTTASWTKAHFTWWGRKYEIVVPIPEMTVVTPPFKISMPTIEFELPPTDISEKTIHIGSMTVLSEVK